MSHKRGKQKSSRFSFCLSSHTASCSAAPQEESDYLLPHFVRMITFFTSICSTCPDTPGRGTAICNCFSQARTQVVPMAKKAASFARSMRKHIYGRNFLKGLTGRTIQLQKKRLPSGSPLSSPVARRPSATTLQEARLRFFSTHSCNWAIDSTNDLSDVFRELAEGASLLGEAIHEIQLLWTGPEELKQANYALQSLPKGLIPKGGTHHRDSQGHGTHGHP